MKKLVGIAALSSLLLSSFGLHSNVNAAYGGKVSLKNTYGTSISQTVMYGRSGIDVNSSTNITYKGQTYSNNTLGPVVVYATASLYNNYGTKISSVSKESSSSTTATATASKNFTVAKGTYTTKTSHTVEVMNSYGKIPASTYRGSSSYKTTT